MRNSLRVLASLTAISVVGLWLITGAHTGWTKTKVTEMEIDPITEIEYPVTEDKFVAGVEVLGGGLLLTVLLIGVSFVFKKPSTTN
jgi:hypothetical protein